MKKINEATTQPPVKTWTLTELSFGYQPYGPDKGKYVGKVRFENNENEHFAFKVQPQMTERYLELILVDLEAGVNDMGKTFITSIKNQIEKK